MATNIATWLQGLGLGQYEPAFRDNAIDAEVLPNLTSDDLREIGVGPVGHRRKMLDSIAALHRTAPEHDAERRQLTVMFTDIVGSTALSTQLDPEDLRDLIAAYHRAVAGTVARFDGFVAKYMGDGVLIYFGYPGAHEDDAERAVRAGLAVIDSVSHLNGPVTLQVRIGIATGLAVVGDLIGTGAAQERNVVGETPNLAARVQGLADPNTVVIAEATRRQIGTLFDLEDLGPRPLAGFAEPQHAWRVTGESGVLSRFEALHPAITPLVGRERELGQLLRTWARAKTGEGQVVVLSAEPGIGKSRLLAAFDERIAAEPAARLRYFCQPHRQDSALHPIIVRLERAAGLARGDTPEQKRTKLARALHDAACREGDIALLSELLSIPGLEPDPDPDPKRKRLRTFQALGRQVSALARRGPILMVFEDVHWIDPTSRELLDLMVAHARTLPALLLITCRPDFAHDWAGRPHVTRMPLTRLEGSDGARLVRHLAGAGTLSDAMIAEIVARTDGVPLFVEELTKAVLESAESGDRVAAVLSAAPLSGLAVPAALHASLMARLDRLGAVAKEVAEVGAVLGRDFSYDLIAPVSGRPEPELRGALDRLTEAGLLDRRGTVPEASYAFRHALVQDAAYGTLLRGPRQELHGRAADALLAAGNAAPETLAHHLQHAGRAAEAIGYWRIAGENASRRAANREAAGHYRQALALVEAMPEAEERWRTELAVLSHLTPPLAESIGWPSAEVGAIVERAAAVGRRLGSAADIAPALANLWQFNVTRSRYDRAQEIADDLMRVAQETNDPEVLLQAHHCSWPTAFYLGRFRDCVAHGDAGAAIYDEARRAHHRYLYLGHDPGVCLGMFGAMARVALGYPEQGLRMSADCVARARRLGHPTSLALALWRAAEVHAACGDSTGVIGAAQELLALTEGRGMPQFRAQAQVFLGVGLVGIGQVAEGLARQREGHQTMIGLNAPSYLTRTLGLLAENLLAANRYEEGLDAVSRAFAAQAVKAERAFLSPLHQVRGDLLLRTRGPDDAGGEADLRQALSIAREQDAKGWELRAATSLARVLAERGRQAEAMRLLAPVYGWFTEGFETADLRAARSVLNRFG